MEVRFELPASVEVRNALGGLLDIAPGSDRVLYAEFGDGEVAPVATVSRYPGCPVDVFERAIEIIKESVSEDGAGGQG